MATGSSVGRSGRLSFSAATDAYARSTVYQYTQPNTHAKRPVLAMASRPPLPQLHQKSLAAASATTNSRLSKQRAKSTGFINGGAAANSVVGTSTGHFVLVAQTPPRRLPTPNGQATQQQQKSSIGRHPSGYLNGSNTTSRVSSGRRGSLSMLERGLVGLSNLGNTCYMNSIVQCLSHTRPLLELLLRGSSDSTDQPIGRLAAAYKRLMRDMWSSGASGAVSPNDLRSGVAKFAPRFRGSGQQDAQEFLRYLLEGLHQDLSRVGSGDRRPRLPPIDYQKLDQMKDSEKSSLLWERYNKIENSPIVDIFVGQLKSTLQCCYCQHKSTTFDPFWDLALPIPKGTRTSLNACLDLFAAEEALDGNERPKCDACHARRRCLKSFCLYRLPQILVIHLMRFSGDRFKTKLNTLVDYPLELDLSSYVDKSRSGKQPAMYSLYAVSQHSGTPQGGHYTAIVRHAYSTDRWLAFNDSTVSRSSESDVVSPQGYVLFYEMKQR